MARISLFATSGLGSGGSYLDSRLKHFFNETNTNNRKLYLITNYRPHMAICLDDGLNGVR